MVSSFLHTSVTLPLYFHIFSAQKWPFEYKMGGGSALSPENLGRATELKATGGGFKRMKPVLLESEEKVHKGLSHCSHSQRAPRRS